MSLCICVLCLNVRMCMNRCVALCVLSFVIVTLSYVVIRCVVVCVLCVCSSLCCGHVVVVVLCACCGVIVYALLSRLI